MLTRDLLALADLLIHQGVACYTESFVVPIKFAFYTGSLVLYSVQRLRPSSYLKPKAEFEKNMQIRSNKTGVFF